MKAADAWTYASERPLLVAAALCLLPPLSPLLVVLSPLLVCVALALAILPQKHKHRNAVELSFTAPGEISSSTPSGSSQAQEESLAPVSPITNEEKYEVRAAAASEKSARSREGPASNSNEAPATSGAADEAADGLSAATAESAQQLAQNGDTAKAALSKAALPKANPGTGAGAAATAAGGAAVLARLRAQRARPQSKQAAKPQQPLLLVLYASQTGTGEEIARSLGTDASQHGFKSKVLSCDELGFEALKQQRPEAVIMVASSTGDGDAPDNATKFFAAMRKAGQPTDALSHIHYACLGLGDSNYTRYMAVCRAIKRRFKDLGAHDLYSHKEADEVDGIEGVVEEWEQGLWPAFRSFVSSQGSKPGPETPAPAAERPAQHASGVPQTPACRVRLEWLDEASAARLSSQAQPQPAEVEHRDESGMYSPEQPFWARVASSRRLTASTSDRTVLHMEFGLQGSGMRFAPGDSLGILPQNDPHLVALLLRRLGWEASRAFRVHSSEEASTGARLLAHLKWPCTLQDALLHGCDLTSVPKKSLLRTLADHTSSVGEREALLHLCSREGKQSYAANVLTPALGLLEVLDRYPGVQPPPADLLDALPALAPRLYSIANMAAEEGSPAEVAFSVVYHEGRGTVNGTWNPGRRGVATGFLEQIHMQLHPESPHTIAGRDPSEAAFDESMDANGHANGGNNGNAAHSLSNGVEESTGPHRVPVFLRSGGSFKPPQDLSAPWLLIGPGTGVAPFRGFLQHRQASEDFLYQEDFEGFHKDSTLSGLTCAFSRAQKDKVYVQHLLHKQGKEVSQLLTPSNAHVFICGDGASMAKDVHEALCSILRDHAGFTSDQATSHLAKMTQEARYIRDIWSA